MQTSIRLFLIAAFAVAALGAQPIVPARAADDTIVFGSAVSLTGSLNKEGKLTQEGYDFWVNYVNAHGGLKVGGKRYKVAIKYYDDESKPANAAQLAERLIDQDHVNFILGPYGSGTTFTVAQMVERKKIVMVEGNGAAEKVFNQGFKYTFGVLSPAKRYLERVIEMALTIKPRPKTLAISAASDAFSLEVQQGVVEYAKAHGIDGRLRQQVSRHRDRRVVGHQRDQGVEPGLDPQCRALAGRALDSEGPQRAKRSGQGICLLGRSGHPGLHELARPRRECRLRRRAVVGVGAVQSGSRRVLQNRARLRKRVCGRLPPPARLP